jgi:hypothetical protein
MLITCTKCFAVLKPLPANSQQTARICGGLSDSPLAVSSTAPTDALASDRGLVPAPPGGPHDSRVLMCASGCQRIYSRPSSSGDILTVGSPITQHESTNLVTHPRFKPSRQFWDGISSVQVVCVRWIYCFGMKSC